MPTEKDGLKRYVEKRNDKLYVYESTSRLENGKKVTKTTYLGRQDPDTGEIMEKRKGMTKAERANDAIVRPAGAIISKEAGNVHFLDAIQKNMGLGDDLIRSFGMFGNTVLGMAIAQVIDPGAFMDIEHTFRRTIIGERFDILRDMSSPRMSDITRSIGESSECIDGFFDGRLSRSGEIVAWDTTTSGTYSVRTGLAEWAPSKDDDVGLRQMKIGIATDHRGVPILFDMFPGSITDSVMTKRFVRSIRGRGKDCIFVADNGFESGGNTLYLIDGGIRFIVPADDSSKAVKKLLTEFPGHPDARPMVHDGHAYRVWETELAIVPDMKRKTADGGDAYTYLSRYDDGFDECGVRVKAFVCYSSKKYSDEEQRLMLWLDSIERELNGKAFKRPMDEFYEVAGKAARFFDVTLDGNVLHLTRKTNALSFADNRAGTFVMLSSSGISWDLMMSAYDARRFTEQAFDAYKNDLDGRRPRTGDKYVAKGRIFVKLIALMMRCEIAARMREQKVSKISVDGILRSMGNIAAVRCGDAVGVTEITKTNRELYASFGIPVPTDRDITNI
jgi:hypothetical protein